MTSANIRSTAGLAELKLRPTQSGLELCYAPEASLAEPYGEPGEALRTRGELGSAGVADDERRVKEDIARRKSPAG